MDESAPISFFAGTAQTKGLIGNADDETPLEGASTRIQVYDYLSGLNGTFTGGTVGTDNLSSGYYIDNVLQYVANGTPTWQFPDNRKYYWTKSGEHKFFAYLKTSPEGFSNWTWQEEGEGGTSTTQTVTPAFDSANKTVSIASLRMTPATTQFDFLYSDVVTRTTDHSAVPLNLKHLFTALAVDIINETGAVITDLSVAFNNVHPTQSATISWSGSQTAATYSPTMAQQTIDNAANMPFGTLDSVPVSTEQQPVTTHFFNGEYRLLWPQAILAPVEATETTDPVAGSEIILSYSYDNLTFTRTADLSDLPITAMEAGKKYLITITIEPRVVIFNVQVKDLENKNVIPEGSTEPSEPFTFES